MSHNNNDDGNFDITTKIPLRLFSSSHYFPFWLLTLSKFLLFLTHNMIAALSTSIYGSMGAYAMTSMYIFFIAGNFIAPALNSLVGHNMALLMFVVSLVYTLFAIVSTFIAYSQQVGLFEPFINTTLFFFIAGITGLAGGAIWIGYGVLNIQLGEHIPKALLSDYLSNHLLDPEEDPAELLRLLQEAVTGKIMSIGWTLLSLNTVFGGLLAFFILSQQQQSQGIESIQSDGQAPLKVMWLFAIFCIISITANISYFVLYHYYNTAMATNDDDEKNNNNTCQENVEKLANKAHTPPAGPITLASSPKLTSQATPLLDNNTNNHPSNNNNNNNNNNNEKSFLLGQSSNNYGTTNTINDPETNNQSFIRDDIQPIIVMSDKYSQWEIFINLIKTPYVLFSFGEYTFAGCAFNFIFASFIANTVKSTLGLANAPLIITAAYTTNAIASYFIGDYINTRLHARNMAIFGNIIQMIPAILPLIISLDNDPLSLSSAISPSSNLNVWLFALSIAGIAGIGDAIHSSSLMTVMASDLKQDTSLCGNGSLFHDTSSLVQREVKEILYSIYSSTKSIGVFMTFLVSGTVSFEWQSRFVIALGLVSLIGQFSLRKRVIQQQHHNHGHGHNYSY